MKAYFSPCTRSRSGFSLIEVVMALGIASSSLLVILGLLPIGLNSMRDSMSQSVVASIAQQLQGELQYISFVSTGSNSISALTSGTAYFTSDGVRTTIAGKGDSAAYYMANFTPVTGSIAGAQFASDNAQCVEVALRYPKDAPQDNQKIARFSIFVAKQSCF